ncbi:MAG: hypothetical protein ABI222_15080 [Opitutaceae bacterium]
MSRPKTAQEVIHWLEEGAGARGITLAAILAVTVALSLRVAWVQFHGATTEATLVQADMGRQLARGEGFTTLVNYPQASAVLATRGVRFDAAKPYPELYQAPLYAMIIAAGLRVLPSGMRESLFANASVPPGGGFGADYFLLGLNLGLFWLAAGLTFLLGRRLFDARTGWLAAGALLVSVTAWQQTVALNGTPLLMVLALLVFWILARLEGEAETPVRFGAGWLAALGATCGLLFLAEYSAGALGLVALGYVAWRREGRARWGALVIVAAGFTLVALPWMARNVSLTGHPVALAAQNVALKTGDITAEPATQRAMLTATMPSVNLTKLANKALTYLQENLKSRLWSGGGLWLTAFFVAGWLYIFRASATNRLRWTFTVALGVLLASQAVFNSGESDRLVACWLAPLVMIFGAGFFFVLLGSNASLGAWPRTCATVLLVAQALPLLHDVLEPRRLHFTYPPYFPALFIGMRQELERRGVGTRMGVMADVPAGVVWYGHQRVWAQPVKLADFYTVNEKQPIAELLLTPRTLDRPFYSELAPRPPAAGTAAAAGHAGEWGRIYGGLVTGSLPSEFPLKVTQRLADNLLVMLNPALPPVRGK